MIVTASLIWWNERTADLERYVRGIATIADRLVAVDGAYRCYPGATVRSSTRQVEAIRRTAEEWNVEVRFILPDRLWAGQVEKRSAALLAASQGSDWVAVADADWVISGDRPAARRELAGLDADVVSVPFHTPPSEQEVATGWHTVVSDTTEWMPHLFRALPEMHVDRYHWHFGARKGHEKVWLWGPRDHSRRLLTPVHLEAPYQVEHMTLHRTRKQILASRAFINDREIVVALTDQEDDVPGLPEPEWDYDHIPLVSTNMTRNQARMRRLLRKRRRVVA